MTNGPRLRSQEKFDEMDRLIREIRDRARLTKDAEIWGKADNLVFLLRDLVDALIDERGNS
jgi:hypothetical protein